MEEVDLRGIKTSRSCGDSKVNRRDDSHSSLSWNFIGLNFSLKFKYGSVTENESDLLLEKRS
jgi:hypothetical protein